MFTGIVEELGAVESIESRAAGARLKIHCQRVLEDMTEGASIAVNGVCLTAVDLRPESFSADLAPETLQRSNLSALRTLSRVNLERPLRPDGRLSGHIVQGHVDGVGKLIGLERIADSENYWLHVEMPREIEKYTVYKGSISIEGISLTVAKLEGKKCTIAIIPHTVEMTNLNSLKPGDPMNLEADLIAKYVEKMMTSEPVESSLTVEELVRQGF